MKDRTPCAHLRIAEPIPWKTDKQFLLSDEDDASFEQMRTSIVDWLLPIGPIEQRLCDQLCRLFWRQDRGQRLEKELLEGLRTRPRNPASTTTSETNSLVSAVTRDGFGAKIFGRIIRYNSQLSLEIVRTLHILTMLQETRAMGAR